MIGLPASPKERKLLYANSEAMLGDKADEYKKLAIECGQAMFKNFNDTKVPWSDIEKCFTRLGWEVVEIKGVNLSNPSGTRLASALVFWFAYWSEHGYKQAMGDAVVKRRQEKKRG